jgi:hypothetical protein
MYKLDNGRWGINPRFSGLAAGVYRVYAKDASDNIASVVVIILDGVRSCGRENTLSINTYPNPTASEFTLSLNTDTQEDVMIEVIDMFGRRVHRATGTFNKKFQFGRDFGAGTYFVKVTQASKVVTQKVIKL